MPAHIINGLITYLGGSQQLNASVWDGEVPRYDTSGNPVNPSSTATNWPVVKLYMEEPGFTRTWTTEDPYSDAGTILIKVWATGRLQTETIMDTIEALLAQASNWSQLVSGGPLANPYYVIQMLLENWYSGQLEEERSQLGELLYHGVMRYQCLIHGAIATA